MGKAVSTTEGLEDLDFGDDVTEAQIEAAIESGDPAAIEALLRGELLETSTPAVADPEIKPAQDEKQDEEGAASGAVNQEQAEVKTEERAPISGKSGVSTIPYAVLEAARNERNELRDKVRELESKNKRVNQILERRGIDLNEITSEQAESLTDEELAQLDEIDPIVGKAIRLFSEKIAHTNAQQYHGESPAVTALRQNKDLSDWQQNDPDRFEFAEAVDKKLLADPKYSSLSYAERFAEAARRTKLAFGDEIDPPKTEKPNIEQIAAQKVAEATKASVPRSLTSIGVTPTSERSLAETFAELSPEEISERMATMSADQIEKLLSGIS